MEKGLIKRLNDVEKNGCGSYIACVPDGWSSSMRCPVAVINGWDSCVQCEKESYADICAMIKAYKHRRKMIMKWKKI